MSKELEKQHLSHLEQLDEVLNYISSKGNSITSREKHFKEISKGSYEIVNNPNDKYNLAYGFLIESGFISNTSDGYKMNYKGLMKLGLNSFVNEYTSNQKMKGANYLFWILAPTFSGLAILLGLLNLFNSICKWW